MPHSITVLSEIKCIARYQANNSVHNNRVLVGGRVKTKWLSQTTGQDSVQVDSMTYSGPSWKALKASFGHLWGLWLCWADCVCWLFAQWWLRPAVLN